MSDQPATVGELLKDAIAEGEELEALTAPEGVEATPKALLYARDFGVDISKVYIVYDFPDAGIRDCISNSDSDFLFE